MGAFQEQVSKKRRGQQPYTDRTRVGRQQVRIRVKTLFVAPVSLGWAGSR